MFLNSFNRLFGLILILLVPVTTIGQVYFTNLEDSLYASQWIGTETVDTAIAFSGNRASLTKTDQPYGIGYAGLFPETVAGKNTCLKISGQVSTDSILAKALFVVTLIDDNKSKFWHGIDLTSALTQPGTWGFFIDSLMIPANFTKRASIKAYLWNQQPEKKVWLDDLEVEFSPISNPSFLPIVCFDEITSIQPSELLFSNEFYQIHYNKNQEEVTISASSGDQLIKSIRFYSDRTIKGQPQESINHLKYVRSKINQNETQLQFRIKTQFSRIKYVLYCSEKQADIRVVVHEKYLKNQEVSREALVFNSAQSVSTVFRANRQADTSDFQTEYWLDKQGVRFGIANSHWSVYHVPQVSSLQLNTIKNQLWVNLDYAGDHPFFRFPLNPDSSNWKIEESSSRYKHGARRQFSFEINTLYSREEIPRFMKNPAGFLATYIWTEHADWTNIRTNRATYFGSENITIADDAIGGFVKYGIPVTKSVFYVNPDSIRNTQISNGLFTDLEISIQDDPMYLDFLNQISEAGSEICLHTPEHYTTTTSQFSQALTFMSQHFDASSWIDHGNNNGSQNNREDLVCDGALKKSPLYALDLWRTYGVRYLHNSYFEDMKCADFWEFNGVVAKPYGGFGDMWPKADYWEHPTKSENMIHWPTTSALFVEQDALWDYYFKMDGLKDFVSLWGTEINHCYPAWADPKKGFWNFDQDSTVVAQPGFNRTLAKMAELRDAGDLNVCTIKTFLDYRTALDSVAYQSFPDGHVLLTNHGKRHIKQLAMTTTGDFVLVNGLEPDQKHTSEGLVFWFELPAGESSHIRILSEK